MTPDPGPTPHQLLERGDEWRHVEAALADTVEERHGVLLISGPAGIGKTALLEALTDHAIEHGLEVLRARCGGLERELAWDMTRQLLTGRLIDASRSERAALLEGPAARAEQVLGLQPPSSTPVALSEALHALRWLMIGLIDRRPTVLIVDDAQWADQESLRWLGYLVDRVDTGPLLIALSMRSGDPDAAREELNQIRAAPHVVHLQPQPLSAAASAELVGRLLGDDVAAAVREHVVEVAAGNPELLHELCRELRASPTAAGGTAAETAEATVADRVADGLRVRLARFPHLVPATAEAAAILGRAATVHRISELLGTPEDDVAEAVGRLVDADILRQEAHLLSFGHPLIRRAIYERLPLARRQLLHGRAAAIIAAHGAPPEEAAVQLLQAAPTADPGRVELLRQAAGRAAGTGAFETASRLLERALVEPPLTGNRFSVLLELGLYEREFDPQKALTHLSQALDAPSSVRARVGAALQLAMTHALLSDFASAVRLLSTTARMTDEPDLVRLIDSARLAFARWDHGAQPLRRRLFARLRGVSAAGAALDPMENANLAHELTAVGEDRELALASARAALRASADALSPTVLQLSSVLLLADHYDEAEQIVLEALRVARERGSEVEASIALTLASQCALWRGDPGRTIQLGSESLELIHGVWSTGAVAWMIEALAERGEFAQATALLESHGLAGPGLVRPGRTGYELVAVLHHRSRMRLLAGEMERALEDAQVVAELGSDWGVQNPAVLDWRSVAATALVALRRHDEALELVEEEVERARRWGAPRALGRALRAAGLSDPGEAGTQRLQEAVDVHATSPARIEHARSLVALGMRLRRERRRLEAQERLRSGLDLAHRSGAAILAEQARHELVAAGARPRRNATRGPAALTERELRIAELARDGHTNGQIARALTVSPRTVEHHLRSIYRKLGIRSRSELQQALSRTEDAAN